VNPKDKGVGPARRVPPPENTGLETQYLEALGRAGSPIRVRLQDGHELEGIVVEFDREILTIEPAVGEAVTIRKSDVRYIEELGSPSS
jgi:hypothetical protein